MNPSPMTVEEALTPERTIANWIEDKLGGDLIALERQGRWRPAWYGTVRTGDGDKQVYIRGDRSHEGVRLHT